MTEKTGCVWLIGAGCGGADLLTVRGRELLGQCDVVVYDDLIGQDLLAQLKDKDLGTRLLISQNMLRHGETVFLDDLSLEELSAALGVPVIPVAQDGFELFEAVFGC